MPTEKLDAIILREFASGMCVVPAQIAPPQPSPS